MVSTPDKWIRIFDIPEISKHKNGFTIYKVISMLYPESCPDAVTKVTVWKRFNEFKKLHNELKSLHRKLGLKSKFPSLPTKTLFKRFDEETIRERKQSILHFLDFIGNNHQLFTSTEFVKFLEISHTPREYLTSNINLIRADLNLPEDPEVCTSLPTISDDERTISDTDSITTFSSLSPSVQNDLFPEAYTNNPLAHSKLKKLNSSTSINSQASSKYSDSLSSTLDNITLLDGQIYPTPPTTPGSTSIDEHLQYIVDASVHVNLAIELENDKKYEEAFVAYKTAIDILIKYGKDDPNFDRRQLVKYKTEKYLIKAERIFNMYLAPEIKDLHLTTEEQQPTPAKRSLFDLYKFKVVKTIASGMLVLHSELQQLFYIKVIHKTVQFLNENLILPENVPYMVKIHNHYNCENALFLVLDYCSGSKLTDYLKNQSSISDEAFARKDTQLLRHIQDTSDNESELSFSGLINDYNSRREKKAALPDSSIKDNDQLSSDDSFEKVEVEDVLPARYRKQVKNIMDEPLKTCEVEDLVSKSQKLLSSVDTALTSQGTKQKYTKRKVKEIDKVPEEVAGAVKAECSERKMSQVSSFDFEEYDTSLVLPEETVVKWAAQLLLALEKLHMLGVICRDLQTKNILIDEKGDLVLTYMCNVKEFGDFFCDGINNNLAPEVYTFQEITAAADWWSYGVILYELLVGMPLSDVHPNGMNSFSHLKIPKYVSAEGKSILKQLLNFEPHDRLGSGVNGTENIKSHPFFHSISWNLL